MNADEILKNWNRNKKKFTMYNVGYFVAELVDAVFALFGDINHIDKTTEKHG